MLFKSQEVHGTLSFVILYKSGPEHRSHVLAASVVPYPKSHMPAVLDSHPTAFDEQCSHMPPRTLYVPVGHGLQARVPFGSPGSLLVGSLGSKYCTKVRRILRFSA